MNLYEGMFLFDPTAGASHEECETEIRRLIDRAGGELVFCKKWDERRLAYKLKGRKRGVYVLTYFRAEADKLTAFERDAQISEPILRLLVLRTDFMTPELMELALQRRQAANEHQEREDERPHRGGRGGGRRDFRDRDDRRGGGRRRDEGDGGSQRQPRESSDKPERAGSPAREG